MFLNNEPINTPFTCIFGVEFSYIKKEIKPPKYTDEELYKIFEKPKIKKSKPKQNVKHIPETPVIVYINDSDTTDSDLDTNMTDSDLDTNMTDSDIENVEVNFSRYLKSSIDEEYIRELIYRLYDTNTKFKTRCQTSNGVKIISDIHYDQLGLDYSKHFNLMFLPFTYTSEKPPTYHAYITDDNIVRLTEVIDLLV
jgi:hypothetical protein